MNKNLDSPNSLLLSITTMIRESLALRIEVICMPSKNICQQATSQPKINFLKCFGRLQANKKKKKNGSSTKIKSLAKLLLQMSTCTACSFNNNERQARSYLRKIAKIVLKRFKYNNPWIYCIIIHFR